ncbi:MAG TPA: SpoIIE family protein phosphatase [Vicinamibacterales bacterium]
MPTLTLQNGDREGESFSFERPVVIGRSKRADISIDDPSASRRHAAIELQGGAWHISDLESANGTLLNGRPVSRSTRLRAGDLIAVGTTIFRYDEPAPATRDSPETIFSVVEDSPSSRIVLSAPVERTAAEAAAVAPQATLLYRLAELFATDFQESAILDFVIGELLNAIPRAERALVLVLEPGTGALVPRAVRTRDGRPPETTYSRTLLNQALTRREGLVIVDASRDLLAAGSHSMLLMGMRSILCAPITFRNEIYGIVQLDSATGAAPFGQAELAAALGLAAQIGMALAYVRLHTQQLERELLERDLALARRVQQDFLPQRPPDVPGYGFAVEYTPAQAVGGDFYDFLPLSPTHVGIVAGDVSGKGVSAAIFAARVTSDLRYQSAGQTQPAAILERVNRSLAFATRDGMFATGTIAVLDTATGGLEIANAGHPLGILRRGDGTTQLIGAVGGPPIGIRQATTFPQTSHVLERGDAVVFYSDGVTEAVDAADEQFGIDRLLDSIRRGGPGPREITRRLFEDLSRFMGTRPQRDDITILSFGRTR